MVMQGWRARLGFLIPPGNPTVEPEMIALAPPGVTVHFSRMVAGGPAGTHHGQEERNRSQIEHIDESAALLAMVKPSVMMLAHTATSYMLGRGTGDGGDRRPQPPAADQHRPRHRRRVGLSQGRGEAVGWSPGFSRSSPRPARAGTPTGHHSPDCER